MASETKDYITSRIVSAFSQTPYPGNDHIVRDGSNASGDSKFVLDYLRGKDWRELVNLDILCLNDSFGLMTAQAIAYYLPAFLIGCLEPEETNVGCTFTIWSISPQPNGTGAAAEFEYQISLLTGPQRACVGEVFRYLAATFPEYFCSEEDPHYCLTDYYEQYQPESEGAKFPTIQTSCEDFRKIDAYWRGIISEESE